MDTHEEPRPELTFGALFRSFRNYEHLSQEKLAERLGVSPGFIGMIESEKRMPSSYTLRKFIRVLNLSPLQQDQLTAIAKQQRNRLSRKKTSLNSRREDWGEAPYVVHFYGREQEQAELERWIVNDLCQVVALLGIGGVGKTTLSVQLAQHLSEKFDFLFWRSLQNTPSLEDVLQKCIRSLSNQDIVDLPVDEDSLISLLLEQLQGRRCLIILDNVESVLRGGQQAGQHREGYEGYGKLLQRLGEVHHQSCLMITSRENQERSLSWKEGHHQFVHSNYLV